nr:acyltransferase [Lachnospiraceae bacterium]
MKSKENYLYSYALLRIIACLAVIVHHVHSQVYFDVSSKDFAALVNNLLMCNNGLFFMLSGKFALENYDGNIKKYYKKKAVSILLPYVAFSFFYYIRYQGFVFAGSWLRDFFVAFMSNQIVDYLWFIPTLIGFYLVAPFFAIMLRVLTEKEKNALVFILIAVIGIVNIGQISGEKILTSGYPFIGYITYCLLGYLADNCEIKKYKKLVIGVGFLCVFVSSYEYAMQLNPAIYDFCVSRILMCLAIFYFITTYSEKIVYFCKKQIKFVSKYTFYIYLFHRLGQEITFSWANSIANFENRGLYCVIYSFLVFVWSLVAAVIFETILSFLRKILYNTTWKNHVHRKC